MSDALPTRRQVAVGLVLLAAAGTFAVTMGARQSMAEGLFTLRRDDALLSKRP